MAMLVLGGVFATMPIRLSLSLGSSMVVDIFKPAAALADQGIGRPVIGDRHLRLIVALRESHDHIATV